MKSTNWEWSKGVGQSARKPGGCGSRCKDHSRAGRRPFALAWRTSEALTKKITGIMPAAKVKFKTPASPWLQVPSPVRKRT
ncbi:hypothetical protein HQN89_30815 [Paenibacillus frigoriresistens]|uniref:hypothetical protein n=1 Tax=Paenibacillus alginolyticus TaxID=59839 RepID=UPI001564D49A|nr:hypothetical protein [Paenibacillus frigoriresistens]NRF95275.1 hypothetical protein [Paenibacillus frigoriresistens]